MNGGIARLAAESVYPGSKEQSETNMPPRFLFRPRVICLEQLPVKAIVQSTSRFSRSPL